MALQGPSYSLTPLGDAARVGDPPRSPETERTVALYCHQEGEPGLFGAVIHVDHDWSTVFVPYSIGRTETLPEERTSPHDRRVYTYLNVPSPSPEAADNEHLLSQELDGATAIRCWRVMSTGPVEFQNAPNDELLGSEPLEFDGSFAYQRNGTTNAGAIVMRDYGVDPQGDR